MTPEEERQTMQMLETLQRANDPRAVALQQNFQRGMEQVTGRDRLRIDPDVVRAKEPAPGRLYGGQVQAPKDTRNPFVQGLSRFTRRAMDALADPVANAQIVTALNSMRMRPDAQLAQAAQGRAQAVQARRQSAQQANMTAEFLRNEGSSELATLIESQPELATFALKQHYDIKNRQPSTIEQKLAVLKAAYPDAPPEKIAQLASGIESHSILSGKQVNETYGSNLPEGRLYKVNDASGEITGIEGAPEKPDETSLIKEYNFAKSQEGFTGSFEDFIAVRYPASDVSLKPLSQGESSATGFYSRVLEAQKILLQPTETGFLENQGTSFSNAMLEKDPTGLARYAMADDYKRYEQAKRDFINANLRRESGAAIAASEFDSAEKQYFPVPGDSPEVIAQKRRNRETVINSLRVASGFGADRLGIQADVVGSVVIFPSGRSVIAKDAQTAIAMANEYNSGQNR